MSSMKMLLMLVVVVSMFTFSEAWPKCPKGLEYKWCKLEYPETCNGDRPNVRMCFQGCNCNPGTVLLNEETTTICVPKTECPADNSAD